MNRFRRSWLPILIVMGTVSGLLVISIVSDDRSGVRGSLGAEIEIVTVGLEPELAPTAAQEQNTTALDNTASMDAEQLDGKLLVFGADALRAAPSSLLREQLERGTPILALNVSLRELTERTEFLAILEAVDPLLREENESFPPGTPGEPFFSYVYFTGEDAAGVTRIGKGQGLLSDPGMYDESVLKLGLAAKGLVRNFGSGGGIEPVESLSTRPADLVRPVSTEEPVPPSQP